MYILDIPLEIKDDILVLCDERLPYVINSQIYGSLDSNSCTVIPLTEVAPGGHVFKYFFVEAHLVHFSIRIPSPTLEM